MSKIHGSFEYKKDGIVVHEDVCPPTCKHTGSKSWKQQAHAALDTWMDNSEGTGYFIIKEQGYPRGTQQSDLLTKQDLIALAKIQSKVSRAVDERMCMIDPDYLNSKEATRLVNMQQSIESGFEEILNMFSWLEATPAGSYDGNRREFEDTVTAKYDARKSEFDSYLKD
jgi:hypothetical protein